MADFAAVHRGPVIGPADVRFDGARRSFNALIEARPDLIVRPVDDADVAAAIGLHVLAGSACLCAAQAVRDRLRPLSTGGYLNYATDDTAETVEDAYGAQTFARLQAAKRTWDPGNLFRHNHNIPPAA